MKLNICSDAIVHVEGQPSVITEYLGAEYAAAAAPDADDSPVGIHIELVDDQSDPEHSKSYGQRVGRDGYGVFLHDGHHRCFRLDFASLSGETWHATCDWDFDPLAFDHVILQMIQLRILCRGKCLLPAAAFERHGRSVLVPASRKAGKTNLLLSFVSQGAQFIADDRVVLDRDGRIQGLGKRLRITYRNLEAFPDLASRLPEPTASLVNLLGFARCGEVELNAAVVEQLEDSVHAQISPADFLGQQPDMRPSQLDALLLLDRRPWDKGVVKTEPADERSLVGSLTALWEQEIQDLLLAYAAYREQTGQRAEVLDAWRPACEAIIHDALRHCGQSCKALIPAHYAAGSPPQVICALLDDCAAPRYAEGALSLRQARHPSAAA